MEKDEKSITWRNSGKPEDPNAKTVCPNCGSDVPFYDGIPMKKCPFCRTPLEER